MQVAAPGDVGNGQNSEAPRDIQKHSEIAPVVAVDEHAAKERHHQPRQRDHDDLPAYRHGRNAWRT